MPVSGLVVTFSSPLADHGNAVEMLADFPEVEIGERCGSKLAIVVDTPSSQRDREVWEAVTQLPGVVDLSVAMIAFEEHSED